MWDIGFVCALVARRSPMAGCPYQWPICKYNRCMLQILIPSLGLEGQASLRFCMHVFLLFHVLGLGMLVLR